MEISRQPPESPIQRLPLELQWCILDSLDSVTSLIHTALSCRSLYAAFKKVENDIIGRLLTRYVGTDVLPEAIIVRRCHPPVIRRSPSQVLELRDKDLDIAEDYIYDFLGKMIRPRLETYTWNVKDALGIERFHYHILGLTDKFIQACATTSDVPLSQSLQNDPPSSTERARIARSFYRFELFRLLCGGPDPYTDIDGNYGRGLWAFFPFFSPVECAQLACVHDFLCYQTALFLDEFSRRYPQGRQFYRGESLFLSPDVQGLLALGLERLHNTFSAKSYEERAHAMGLEDGHHFAFYKFLDHALECYWAEELENFSWSWGDMQVTGRDFYEDPDPGPKEMWILSQRRNDAENMVNIYHQNDRSYRKWGFVMWDSKRLRELGVIG